MRKMKDSGIEWIGEIPEEWTLAPVKRFFKNTKVLAGDSVDSLERLALTMSGVIKRSKEDSEGLQPEKFDTYQILRENELVFKLIDLANVKTSRVGLSPYTGIVSPAYIILTNNNSDNRFYYYYFMSMYYNEVFNHLGGDGVRSSLNALDLLNVPMVNVDFDTQSRIADFLDDKCGKIDRYIETQRAIVEKLKAYKQAVITEAVTKGLDPTVPMKDSGNREVGFIPAHWKLGKLLYFSNKIGDGLHGTPEYDNSGDCYFINGNNLGQNELVIKGDTKSVSDKEWRKYYIELTDKTLLISLNGTIGNVTPYHNEKVILGKSAGYITLKDSVDISYIQYYLQSKTTHNIFELSFSGTTIKNLSLETLRNLPICIMPLVEQKQIATYLRKVCDNVNNSIFRKQSLIDKLTEYKKSLIYEAVTGKLEV